MKNCRFLLVAAVGAALVGGVVAPAAEGGARYRVTEIPTFGGDYSDAEAINELGHITGVAAFRPDRSGNDAHAYLYADGRLVDLRAQVPRHGLGQSASFGRAINGSDVVAGGVSSASGDIHPARFDPEILSLFQPEWLNYSGNGINDAGDVVGGNASDGAPGFVYHDGVVTPLPADRSVGFDINDAGVVVGATYFAGSDTYGAFVLRGGTLTVFAQGGEARAINERGEIVGDAPVAGGDSQAFRTRAASQTTVRPLGALPGDTRSAATAISEDGQVVGWSGQDPSSRRAVAWVGSSIVDLNARIAADSGWQLLEADGVNSAGQIVGFGLHDGHPRGFVLDPV